MINLEMISKDLLEELRLCYNIKKERDPKVKTDKEIAADLEGKIMDIYEIDEYMELAGYESILPADEKNIRECELIWYPFELFPCQVNILVKPTGDKYFITHMETTN